MASATTTFIVQADNEDGFDTRASSSTSYSHAVVVGPKGDRGAISWHKSEANAVKAAAGYRGHYTKPEVVAVESRNGSKATVVKQLKAELAPASTKSASEITKAKAVESGIAAQDRKAAKATEAKAEPKAVSPAKAELIASNPGYVISTKSRSTKTVAVLIDARAGHKLALDESKGRWQTICLDHGKTAAHAGQRPARDSIGHPELWCPTCKKAAAKA